MNRLVLPLVILATVALFAMDSMSDAYSTESSVTNESNSVTCYEISVGVGEDSGGTEITSDHRLNLYMPYVVGTSKVTYESSVASLVVYVYVPDTLATTYSLSIDVDGTSVGVPYRGAVMLGESDADGGHTWYDPEGGPISFSETGIQGASLGTAEAGSVVPVISA